MFEDRKPFVCAVDGIEVHGTIEQELWNRAVGEKTSSIFHYKVGLIVAGIRKYEFVLHPDFSDDVTPRYKVLYVRRLSVVRDHVIDTLKSVVEPLPVAQAFEAGIKLCVSHYQTKPPVFPVPAEAQVGEV